MTDLVLTEHSCGETVNVANIISSSIVELVGAFEAVLGHDAVFDIIERGAGYAIDTDRIRASSLRCGVSFSGDYLHRTIRKYYGHHDRIEPVAT